MTLVSSVSMISHSFRREDQAFDPFGKSDPSDRSFAASVTPPPRRLGGSGDLKTWGLRDSFAMRGSAQASCDGPLRSPTSSNAIGCMRKLAEYFWPVIGLAAVVGSFYLLYHEFQGELVGTEVWADLKAIPPSTISSRACRRCSPMRRSPGTTASRCSISG